MGTDKPPYITINFFPPKARQPRLRPIAARLVITDGFREAMLKLGFFTKEIGIDEHIAIVCHDTRVAQGLAAGLREAAVELEAAIVKASNPFAK